MTFLIVILSFILLFIVFVSIHNHITAMDEIRLMMAASTIEELEEIYEDIMKNKKESDKNGN